MAKNLRLAVIGLGNIAQQHIENIYSGAVRGCDLVGVCSRTPPLSSALDSVAYYPRYQDAIDSPDVDAVLIATPTMSHFEIAKYALENKKHVLLEKPIGLSSLEGDKLIGIQPDGVLFALMLNQRLDPVYAKMKSIVDSGVLGELQRFHWTMTNWFRPEVYFKVSDWRATWKGEGGGLLLNQCIHNLDIFQYICGMPSQVHAFCEFGRHHNIEVEDQVTAFMRYGKQASAVFVASTGEAPGMNRFDIVGDKGSLHYDSGRLEQKINRQSAASFSRTTQDMFGLPDCECTDIVVTEKVNQHACILNNFIAAVDCDTQLIAPAQDGLASLDMANAMLLSTWENRAVSLPFDRAYYQSVLDEKIAASSLREKAAIDVEINMAKSYR